MQLQLHPQQMATAAQCQWSALQCTLPCALCLAMLMLQVGHGKPGFFAIASPPDPNNQGLLEFLIKAQGEAAEALAGTQAGTVAVHSYCAAHDS